MLGVTNDVVLCLLMWWLVLSSPSASSLSLTFRMLLFRARVAMFALRLLLFPSLCGNVKHNSDDNSDDSKLCNNGRISCSAAVR